MFQVVDKKNPARLVFRISNIDLSIVNSLRRIAMTSIPNVSLDFDMEHPDYSGESGIIVHKNTSSLHNELIFHRISLIPFCFSEKEIEEFDSTKYTFKLKAAAKAGEDVTLVTTKEIEIFDTEGAKYPTEFHARVFPVNRFTKEHVMITKLHDGQEIDLEFKLTKATAEKHAKWCPVSQCTYSYVPDTLKVAKHSGSILDIQRNFVKDKWGEPSLFEFKLESECALTPGYVFGKSIDILKDKVMSIPDKVDIDVNNKLYYVNISGEDSTVVNVLQALIYNNCIREPPKEKVLEFTGYYQPHPLVKHVILKLKPYGDYAANFDAKVFLAEQCDRIASELDLIKAEWDKFL
jgi:DNA-directed RNA polymerase subunit L